MTALDTRLRAADPSTATLAQVFAEHFRGVPAAMTCPGCGHRFAYNDSNSDCPTNTVVRTLLLRRCRNNKTTVARLLSAAALHNLLQTTPKPWRAKASAPVPVTGDLFDVTAYHRYGGTR